jgi:hypothetical protein
LDGSDWAEAIVKALPKVKKYVGLNNFSFSKEQLEAILDNSLHLKRLWIIKCKLRKWCYSCDALIYTIWRMGGLDKDLVESRPVGWAFECLDSNNLFQVANSFSLFSALFKSKSVQ